VLTNGNVTLYLYNPTAAALDDGSTTWKFQVIDLTP
jgi:hypothetical protein